MVGITGDILG